MKNNKIYSIPCISTALLTLAGVFMSASCAMSEIPGEEGEILSSHDARYPDEPELKDPAKRAVKAKAAWARLDELFGDVNVRTAPLGSLFIRDICILPAEDGLYYMTCFGSVSWKDGRRARGFVTYASEDLENWRGPFPGFIADKDFWMDDNYWAPELHKWKGQYYLFGTTGSEAHRGTQIFRSTSGNPAGPYVPVSPRPATPEDWMCLDGTLYVTPEGKPWMVFCHEWVQVTDGTVCAAPLSDDLSKMTGEPILLFRGSEAPWSHPDEGKNNYVTDGCYLYREDGKLKMLWSAFDNGSYQLAIATSKTGKLEGPWEQSKTPIYTKDGGHGMHFITFEGKHKIILHSPNRASHPVLIDCEHEEKTSD